MIFLRAGPSESPLVNLAPLPYDGNLFFSVPPEESFDSVLSSLRFYVSKRYFGNPD